MFPAIPYCIDLIEGPFLESDPEVAEALCPTNHYVGTKRACLDTNYYETYNLPHVRLVDLRKDPEKFSYDKWTASLTSTTRRFQLEQPVELRFIGIDRDNQHQASFELVEGCGLKPPKEEKPAVAE